MAEGKIKSPYKNFRFRVLLDTGTGFAEVAGVSKVGGLKRKTEVIEHRDGSSPLGPVPMPGKTKYEPITLERGVTHDLAFEDWAHKASAFRSGLGSLQSGDFRKDLRIEVFNDAGQLALAYSVYNCWVSDYQALPDLDANGNAVAIQSMTIQNEGWQRDLTAQEPTMPKFGLEG